jgi:threonine/homoserine/homoserine lactone efflux protein
MVNSKYYSFWESAISVILSNGSPKNMKMLYIFIIYEAMYNLIFFTLFVVYENSPMNLTYILGGGVEKIFS